MHELQVQLEETFGEANSEDGFGSEHTSAGMKLLKIPGKGGKKVMSILKKTRKKIKKHLPHKKDEVEFRQEPEPIKKEERPAEKTVEKQDQ